MPKFVICLQISPESGAIPKCCRQLDRQFRADPGPLIDHCGHIRPGHTKAFYDRYAIKAIRFAAFDYLLKPVDIEELIAVIQRIRTSEQNGNTAMRIEALAHNLKHTLNKITIPTMAGLLFFNIGDIIHIEAQSNYTVFSFANRPKLTVSKTLKEFEDLLPTEHFFRPHHSHIINLQFIKRYIKGDGGQIEMNNGDYVDVSRRKKEKFLKLIGF